jgi:hypothetical protein
VPDGWHELPERGAPARRAVRAACGTTCATSWPLHWNECGSYYCCSEQREEDYRPRSFCANGSHYVRKQTMCSSGAAGQKRNLKRRQVVRCEKMGATRPTALAAGATLAAGIVTLASIAGRWDGERQCSQQCNHDRRFWRCGRRSRRAAALQRYKGCSLRQHRWSLWRRQSQ